MSNTCDHSDDSGASDCDEPAIWEFEVFATTKKACREHKPTHLRVKIRPIK